MLSCKSNRNGFSLLELIVGIAILSIGITSVLQALSFSARTAGFSCDIIKAVFLAEDKMQELEFKEAQGLINKEEPQVNNKSGKFEYGYILDMNPDLNLYELTFNINWQWSNRKEELKIRTYLRQ